MSHLGDDLFDEDEIPHEDRARARKRRRIRRGGVSCLALLLALALVAGAVVFAFGSLRSLIPSSEPTDFPGPGHGQVKVEIEEGASGAQIGETLVDKGVVKTVGSFTSAASARPEAAAKIQPGSYAMKKEMTGADAFQRLLNPKARTSTGTTIPEGRWRSEIYTTLSKATGVPVAEYEKAEKSSKLELPAEAKGKVEGWLFPSTYQFDEDASAVEHLNKMIAQTKQALQDAQVPRSKWQRTLIVASIVEGEAGAADRGKVARVIENRLANPKGPTKGMLQMDSTIHYILQKRGTVTTSDKARKSKSPYNTYTHRGLPPGPISNPGAAAIDAASSPTPGDWYFFVTVNPETGETKFTDSKAEHDKYVQEFCKNTGSCESATP